MRAIGGIKLNHLEKSYRVSGETHPVFHRLSLELDSGEITVVLGKSGCGKTTLLRILAGLEERNGGEIAFEAEEKLGIVFQEPRLMPWLNVRDNILFGLPKKERTDSRAGELLKLTGLEGFERARPAQLSGGMKQRAALARALACRPTWLLMDEPFAALDPFTREAMQKELLRICGERPVGVLFVTHSIDEALTLGDRILILGNGGLLGECFADKAAGGKAAHSNERNLLSPEMIRLRTEIMRTMEGSDRKAD